jgi:hypothetical protein
MTNIENDVFTAVATATREQFPGIYMVGEYLPVPASFPAVMLYEADNYVVREGSTIRIDDFVRVMYSVSVFSNKTSGKKSEAKAIADFIDGEMTKLGFTRTVRMQVPNLADATIYRLESRYEAVVGEGREDGTYIIYQSY